MKPVDTETINVQAYWEEPAPPPSADPGMHRFALNVASLEVRRRRIPPRPGPASSGRRMPPAGNAGASREGGAMASVRGAPTLKPGDYTVRLTVDGQTYTQPVTVKPDPRNVPDAAESPPQAR